MTDSDSTRQHHQELDDRLSTLESWIDSWSDNCLFPYFIAMMRLEIACFLEGISPDDPRAAAIARKLSLKSGG